VNFRLYQRRTDWVLMIPPLLLALLGVVTVYSATHVSTAGSGQFFSRHLVYAAVALGAFVFFFVLPLRLWEDWAYGVYGLSIVLLILVLLVGEESHGARRWLGAGPFRFQPSEFAKVALLAALARYLGNKKVDLARAGSVAIAFGMIALPALLVSRQPNLSTAAAFPAIGLPMLFLAGFSRVLLFVMLSPVAGILLLQHHVLWGLLLVLSVVIFLRARLPLVTLLLFLLLHVGLHWGAPRVIAQLEPYQQARIHTFFDPGADPSGTGWQVLQSRIAIGSGEMAGKGYLQGSQKALAFLPMQHNDFIFSVIGEEWGFLGASFVVLLFALFVLRAVQVSTVCRSPFGAFLLLGGGGLIFYHAAVNIAMTMGLFPVTGLPLPLLSYGGSFLITVAAVVGQMGNAAVHRFDN
jgi:rod shape determining protein RodA